MLSLTPTKVANTPCARPLAPADIGPLAEWLCRLPLYQRYGFQTHTFAASLRYALDAGDWLQVILADEQTCAFAWCLERGTFGLSPYLRLIAVQDTYQSRGIGRELLQAAEAWAQQIHPSLTLLVSDFNHAAQRFYQREGYRESGRMPQFVLPDVAEIIYIKQLTV